jgi:beta-glucanase (GH16 family)
MASKKNRGRVVWALGGLALAGLAACQPAVAQPQWTPVSNSDAPVNEAPGGTPATSTPRINNGGGNATTTIPRATTTTAPRATTTTTAPRPTTTTTVPVKPPVTPPVTAPAGWKLVGGDEFNGTAVDGSKWKQYNNTYGDGNHEMACLTPNNNVESGGSLKITAKKQTVTCPSGSVRNYTSGFLGSREVGKYYPKYARFEMRAKLPHAQGLWPAFWLRHRNGAGVAEVDIMEYFHSLHPGKTSSTLHLDGQKNTSQRHNDFESTSATPGWHTWAVEISKDPGGVRFDFFLDNVKVHTFVDAKHAWASSDDASTWDMALNMAVGGSWTGDPGGTLGYLGDLGRCSLGGTAPSGCTTTGIKRANFGDSAATTYEIDYVRVYTH